MSRRDYTNQHGVFTPTESEAINNIMGKKPKDERVYVKKHPSVMREEELAELDKNRKSKSFAEFMKEELEKEEQTPLVVSMRERADEFIKLRKAYGRAYYEAHKDAYKEASRRYAKTHREKIREYQREYYRKRKNGDTESIHHYIDLDGIRLVKEGNKIVGWYRPMLEEEM